MFSKIKKNTEFLVIGIASILSVASYIWSYKNDYTIIYNDSMAHLNISRLVFDSLQPGLSQLGTVWLPLNHILMLALVWNDWAWHSGFAGSIFSMIAYVVSVLSVYKIVWHITNNKLVSFGGAMIIALNLNILYLQTTPLTEIIFLALFSMSVLVFVKWLKYKRLYYLIALGILGFFQTMIRYDGWFVVGLEAAVIFVYTIVYGKKISIKTIDRSIGNVLLFIPAMLGIFIWILYNKLIYGSWLYFALGEGSAHSQQKQIEKAYGLATKHNIINSIEVFYNTIIANIGTLFFILAIVGGVVFLIKRSQIALLFDKILFILILVSPIIFNIIALFLGFSTINISNNSSGELFNVRYGIMAMPTVAIFTPLIALLFRRKVMINVFISLVVFFICFQSYEMYTKNNIITLNDGKVGMSSYRRLSADLRVPDILKKNVDKNEKVLVSMGSFNSVLFKSNINLKQFIHEGVFTQWKNALKNPENYVSWILIRDRDLTSRLINKDYKKYYYIFYKNNSVELYKMKDEFDKNKR